MDSIAKQDQERALRAVAFWCVSQAQGIELEESVIKRLGFGSVEAMHQQLANWGLPDWITGDAPKSSEPDKPPRRGQTASGEPIELPPAHGAALLFYQALQKLNRAIGDLDNRKEYLQNGRFVAQEDTARGVWPEMGIEVGPLPYPSAANKRRLSRYLP